MNKVSQVIFIDRAEIEKDVKNGRISRAEHYLHMYRLGTHTAPDTIEFIKRQVEANDPKELSDDELGVEWCDICYNKQMNLFSNYPEVTDIFMVVKDTHIDQETEKIWLCGR